MQARREHHGHEQQPTWLCLWEDLVMAQSSHLVARLHVDLQRVASAVCSAR
jgi:hypothetical protein